MNREVPNFLQEMLVEDYGKETANSILENCNHSRKLTLRANTLKTNIKEIKENLVRENIKYKEVSYDKNALIIESVEEEAIKKLAIYKNGEIYLQSLSSMIPALIINPKADENILDMAAAPGGKTTQMAAISNNNAMITACEKNKIRLERLKYNLQKQGATRVNVINEDARKLDNFFSFDKILLDAPCSGSGTESIYSKNFNEELINRSARVQEELLKKAIQIVKVGGDIVYSTCSILKKENEDIISKILNKKNLEIVPINKKEFEGAQILETKIDGTLCIMPNSEYEGFFVAKIRKLG